MYRFSFIAKSWFSYDFIIQLDLLKKVLKGNGFGGECLDAWRNHAGRCWRCGSGLSLAAGGMKCAPADTQILCVSDEPAAAISVS